MNNLGAKWLSGKKINFTPCKSDFHLISTCTITPESHLWVTRKKEMLTNDCNDALDCSTNSPFQNNKKCIENSMENMHSDVGV